MELAGRVAIVTGAIDGPMPLPAPVTIATRPASSMAQCPSCPGAKRRSQILERGDHAVGGQRPGAFVSRIGHVLDLHLETGAVGVHRNPMYVSLDRRVEPNLNSH